METETGDEIQRKIVIRAPRAKVWRILTDIKEFSQWFSVETDGHFEPGVRLHMTSTHPQGNGASFYVEVLQIVPEELFSWRWAPNLVEKPGIDFSKEPTTVVEFRLESVDDGTLVTVTESGFNNISLSRRAKAFEANVEGWRIQLESLDAYVSSQA